MFVIAGLGNPGLQYEKTRHNVGFDVIDAIADKYNITMNGRKKRARIGKGVMKGQKVILVKPQTYMNLSGESISEIVDYYKIEPEEGLLVIYDDVSLNPGQIRIRSKGSAGGHNGMKNIIANLGTDVFARIKVGIGGKPDGYDLKDYVLSRVSGNERKMIEEAYKDAVSAAEKIVAGEVQAAMNEYNRKVKLAEIRPAETEE